MNDTYVAIRECGWAGWICVLLFLPGLITGLVALLVARRSPRVGRTVGVVAIVFGVAAMGNAVLGRQSGLIKVRGATSSESLDAGMRDRIRAEGEREANQCLKVGAVTGGLPFALGIGGVALAVAALKRSGGIRS